MEDKITKKESKKEELYTFDVAKKLLQWNNGQIEFLVKRGFEKKNLTLKQWGDLFFK